MYVCVYIYICDYVCVWFVYVHPFTDDPLVVVVGMRLIRRPWKGCRFWDVPFTIPWKGCKFQKWGFPKWGYRIWNFRFFNVLHMEEAYVAYVVVWSSGGWGGVGWRGALASTSRSAKASSPMTALFYSACCRSVLCLQGYSIYLLSLEGHI